MAAWAPTSAPSKTPGTGPDSVEMFPSFTLVAVTPTSVAPPLSPGAAATGPLVLPALATAVTAVAAPATVAPGESAAAPAWSAAAAAPTGVRVSEPRCASDTRAPHAVATSASSTSTPLVRMVQIY